MCFLWTKLANLDFEASKRKVDEKRGRCYDPSDDCNSVSTSVRKEKLVAHKRDFHQMMVTARCLPDPSKPDQIIMKRNEATGHWICPLCSKILEIMTCQAKTHAHILERTDAAHRGVRLRPDLELVIAGDRRLDHDASDSNASRPLLFAQSAPLADRNNNDDDDDPLILKATPRHTPRSARQPSQSPFPSLMARLGSGTPRPRLLLRKRAYSSDDSDEDPLRMAPPTPKSSASGTPRPGSSFGKRARFRADDGDGSLCMPPPRPRSFIASAAPDPRQLQPPSTPCPPPRRHIPESQETLDSTRLSNASTTNMDVLPFTESHDDIPGRGEQTMGSRLRTTQHVDYFNSSDEETSDVGSSSNSDSDDLYSDGESNDPNFRRNPKTGRRLVAMEQQPDNSAETDPKVLAAIEGLRLMDLMVWRPLGLLICTGCGCAVDPASLKFHLSREHNTRWSTNKECKKPWLTWLETLNVSKRVPTPNYIINRIPHIPHQDGFYCTVTGCSFASDHLRSAENNHIHKTMDDDVRPKGERLGIPLAGRFEKCVVQRPYRDRYKCWWRVNPSSTPMIVAEADPTRDFVDALVNEQKSWWKSEPADEEEGHLRHVALNRLGWFDALARKDSSGESGPVNRLLLSELCELPFKESQFEYKLRGWVHGYLE